LKASNQQKVLVHKATGNKKTELLGKKRDRYLQIQANRKRKELIPFTKFDA